jgi:hypothetical protein
MRTEFQFLKAEGHTLAVFKEARRVDWYNFAGGAANDIISSHLARIAGLSCQPNDLALSFPEGTDATKLMEQLASLTALQVAEHAVFDEQAVEALKFHECLPPPMQQAVLKSRLVKQELLESVLSIRTTSVFV